MYANLTSMLIAALPKVTAKFLEVDKIHPNPHTGIDFAVSEGTKLLSAGNGIVENIVDYGNENIGRGVFIRLEDGTKLVYGHLSSVKVKIGQHVEVGDLVALSGNTGHSTGAHLHLQAYDASGQLINPMGFASGVFSKYKDSYIDRKLDEMLDKFADKISDKVGQMLTAISKDIIDVVAIGAIFYSLYQCIHMMFLGNKSAEGKAKPMDKAILAYFTFFILRILNTAIKLRSGSFGK